MEKYGIPSLESQKLNYCIHLMNLNIPDSKKTAEDILKLVLQKDSENPTASILLAELHLTGGDPDQAAILFQATLNRQPDHIIAMNNLAWILSNHQKKHREALQLTQRAMAINPDYIDLIDTRGVIFYNMREHQKAIAEFEKCLILYQKGNPAVASVHFHLGKSFNALGKTSDAIIQLKNALTLHQKKSTLSTADLFEVKQLLAKLE